MQLLAEAAMEREAYAEEVGLFSCLYCSLNRLLQFHNMHIKVTVVQARQAGAVSRLTKVLATTGRAEISVVY